VGAALGADRQRRVAHHGGLPAHDARSRGAAGEVRQAGAAGQHAGVANFTTGGLHPSFQQGDVYGNVLYAFKAWPLLAAFYVVAMVFTGLHLYHGAWAMLRTLGVAKPSANPLQRTVVKGIAWAVAIGFIIIPTTIVLGLVG
jgi:hypothetical protein